MLSPSLQKQMVYWTPVVIMAAVYLLLLSTRQWPPPQREMLLLSPYLTAAGGLFLSVHFNRGRTLWGILLLVGSYWLYRSHLAQTLDGYGRQAIYQGVALLVPPNLALLAFLRERGVISATGQVRAAFFLLQGVVVYLLLRYNFDLLQSVLQQPYLPDWLGRHLVVSQPAFLLALSGCSALLVAASLRRTPSDIGFLGALAAFFIAWNSALHPDATALYLTAAQLVLIVALLQDTYNMAFRDDLTGIPSRRALNERLAGLGRRYAVAMVDIDHFKSFNDSYGHDVGDQVLRLVAKKLAQVGGGGEAFRYGGEEFTLLFPNREGKEVLPFLEELRESIADYPLQIRGADRPPSRRQGEALRRSQRKEASARVTVSMGVAVSSAELIHPEQVIKAADKALYRAKQSGRNRVCSG